jgi:Domain of unknown function (DUF5979)
MARTVRSGASWRLRAWTAWSTTLCLVVLAAIAVTPKPAVAAGSPDFQITVSPVSQTLQPGSFVKFAVGIGTTDGFSDPVTLSVGSDGPGGALPSGVTADFSVNPVVPPGTSFLTLTASQDATRGTFPVNVTASGGGVTHTATGSATVDFGLVPACTGVAEGTVTDAETGQGIAGADVGEVVTDVSGHYRLEGIPLDQNNSPREFSLRASKEPGYWFADKNGIAVGILREDGSCEPQVTRLDFSLVPVHPAHLSGTVVEGHVAPPNFVDVIPTSTPIEGATVYLSNHQTSAGPQVTDVGGNFDLGSFRVGRDNVPIDLALIGVKDADSQLPAYWRDGYWPSLTPIHAEAGDQLVRQVALVKKCTGSISGHVADEVGEDAVGVRVDAFVPNLDGDSAITDDQGNFLIPRLLLTYNNAPVSYIVYVYPNGSPNDGSMKSATIETCGDDGSADLLLPPHERFGDITGRVLDEETLQPVQGATVGLPVGPAYVCPCDETDAEGRYRLDDVSLGTKDVDDVSVTAFRDDYWFPPLHVVTVHVSADPSPPGEADDILLLRRRYGSATGIVRDAITHEPIVNATITDSFYGASDATDGQGRYALENLQLGYRNAPRDVPVSTSAQGYWPKQSTIGISAGQLTVQDLELMPICEDATISGTVVNALSQEPIEGASVNGVVTDAQGHYVLQHIPVGTDNSPTDVQVTASAPGFYTQTKTVKVFCAASITLDFGREGPKGAIEGYVTHVTGGSPGVPIEGVFIGSGFGGFDTTDASGYYKLVDVPLNADGSPRSWDVTAQPDGFPKQTKTVIVAADPTARLDFEFSKAPQTGMLSIVKTLDPGGAASDLPDAYEIHYDCGTGHTGEVTIAAGGGPVLADGAVPLGTSCTVSEPTLPDAPDGYTFGAPSFSPSATVQIDGDTPSATITVNNSLARDTGSLHVAKMITGAPAGFAGSFGISVACTGDGGIYTRTISYPTPGDVTVSGIPTGNTCTVSETSQSTAPTGFSWGTTVITGSPTAVIDASATREVTVTNVVTGRLKFIKTKSGLPLSGTDSFTFQLRRDASTSSLGTIVESVNATSGNGGVVGFSTPLEPGRHYQACELVMPGWNTSLQGTLFVPGSIIPPALPNPNVDNSPVCVDFVAQAGVTTTFRVDNTFPGGLARTIGFWKNWASCAKSKGGQRPVLDQTLALAEPTGIVVAAQAGTYPGFSPAYHLILHGSPLTPNVAPDCGKAINLLNKSTFTGEKMANDPAFNLAAQLIAAELNFTAGAAKNGAVITAVNQAVTLLGKYAFDGKTHTKISAIDVTGMNNLAKTLDNYNNNRP